MACDATQNLMVSRLGSSPLKLVQRAAVGAARFAAVIQRNHHFRMRIPQVHAGHRAGQRQIGCGDFDIALRDVLPVLHKYSLPAYT